MSYVESAHPDDECIFCSKPAAANDRGEMILERGTSCFTLLNAFPYNCGHLMVAPYRHVDSLSKLEPAEREELVLLLGRAEEVLRSAYHPDGFNAGVNLGAAAGAGIPRHLHAHLVPRWVGDTNFMSTVGETRVMPESLEQTYERLVCALARVAGGA
jgi:ATP adenylyltransferase